MFAGNWRFQRAVPAFFQHHGGPGDQPEHCKAYQQRRPHTPGLHDRGGRERRQGKPPVGMMGGGHRTDDEEQQGHQHAPIATANGEQRARSATAAQLHADAEDERTEHDRNPRRSHQAGDRVAEQAAS
ncbi:hypothetical protein D3C80_1318730 [compost metagenome]